MSGWRWMMESRTFMGHPQYNAYITKNSREINQHKTPDSFINKMLLAKLNLLHCSIVVIAIVLFVTVIACFLIIFIILVIIMAVFMNIVIIVVVVIIITIIPLTSSLRMIISIIISIFVLFMFTVKEIWWYKIEELRQNTFWQAPRFSGPRTSLDWRKVLAPLEVGHLISAEISPRLCFSRLFF